MISDNDIIYFYYNYKKKLIIIVKYLLINSKMPAVKTDRKSQKEEISSYVINFENNVNDLKNDKIPTNIISFHAINKSLKINDTFFIINFNKKRYEVFPTTENFKPCHTYECKHAKLHLTSEFYIVFTENDNFISSVGLYNNTDNTHPHKKAKFV